MLDGVHAPIATPRLLQEGSVTSALLYPWKVQGMRLLWLLQGLGEEIQGRL